jgi:hypothetical protein
VKYWYGSKQEKKKCQEKALMPRPPREEKKEINQILV